MASKQKQRSKKTIQANQSTQGCLYLGNTELGEKILGVMNGGVYAIINTIVLMFTLFSDDIRQIFFPLSADDTFTYLTFICMVYYAIEIVLFSLLQKDYFLKYYFWLDIISTATMAFDLTWVSQYFTGSGKSAINISQLSRASRAARLGTRTIRLIRLIRMVKIIKKMKAFSKDLNNKKEETPTKKHSQRLSSIHSKLASLKNVEKLASLRHMQKLPSKRWSLIKQTNCMNVIGANPKQEFTSINCLPFREKDDIVERSDSNSSKVVSSKIVVINKTNSNKSIPAENKQHINNVVILENIQEDCRQEQEKGKDQAGYVTKNMMMSKKSQFDKTNKDIKDQSSDGEIQVPPETKVGAKVQNQIQKNVILMIILVLVSIPLLDGSTWYSSQSIYSHGIQDLMYFANDAPKYYQKQADMLIANHLQLLNPLIYFQVSAKTITDKYPDYYPGPQNKNDILSVTRLTDLEIYIGDGYTVAYDVSNYNYLVSLMNIGRTVFVCILLVITTMLFANDLQFAAIAPLEEMFDTVKKIAIHPLNALREIQEKNMCMQKIEQDDGSIPSTQPKVLQNTIVKIGSLLAVGFGQAGTQIICKVIEDPAIINVMIPGQKIMALFGFCDIRNFTDATEVLEADVMVFVNQIAAICHKVTYDFLGSPNKNIGDAFLLVWKFAQNDCKAIEEKGQLKLELTPSARVSQKADLAVLALIKMISQITRAQKLQKYKNNKGLQERISNYNGVKMGFGLHIGWAIEGPIGSEYKIDASYLSPHVHMASRLEAATKGYGASMLITGAVYDLMTKNKSHLRQVDRVIPDGESEIMNLYTVDLMPKHLFEELGVKEEKTLDQKEKRVAKVCQNMNRNKLISSINEECATDALWVDEDLRIMQQQFTGKFYEEWNKGFKSYLDGRWDDALAELNLTMSLAPGGFDGPSDSLIKFIEGHNCKAPENWEGFREFD